MKTKISRIGKKSLSVIIALMMIVSTMLVGMVSASAFTVSSAQTIYFKPSSDWSSSSYFGLRVKWGSEDTNENFYMMSLVSGETDIYTVEFPTGSPNGFQFVKFKSNNAIRDNVDSWDSYQTSLDTSKNLYTMGTGWSAYSGGSSSTTNWKIFGDNYGGWTGSNGQDLTAVSGQSNLYSIELSSLSGYFAFYDGNSQFGPSNDKASLPSSSASAATISSANSSHAFNVSTSVSNVTVYLNDADSNNIKVWYESTTTPTTEPTTTPTPTKTYYLTGRFGVKKDGNMTYLGGSLNSWVGGNTSDITFTQDPDSTLYKLETGQTIKELAANTGDNTWYFQISDGTTKYRPDTGADKELTISDNNTEFGTGTSAGSFHFTGNDETGNVTLYFDSSSKKFHFEVEGGTSTTDGAFKISDKTEGHGKLSISAPGKTPGTADANDEVTITVTPESYFSCTSLTVTGADKTAITTTGSGNSYTFIMPSQAVTVKATFTLDKTAYIASLGNGLWIDVDPDHSDTSSTLIKWNNYSGSDHNTSTNPYIFYVPKNVDLSNAHIYNGYSAAVTLNGTSIPGDGTAVVSLAKDTSYTTSGGVSTTVKVMQGSTDAMFLYTTKSGSAYSLPTQTGAGASKGDVKTDGGVCKTMSNTTSTASYSSVMNLDSVKGRGNSSWSASNERFGKYAFNMKLATKTNLLGMDSAESKGAKSWCLLANNADESMLRNALTYQLADEIGLLYSPEFRFVDIYDNGEYLGSYLVTEKVDVGSSKLVKGESFDDINEKAAGTVVEDAVTNEKYSYGGKTHEMSYAKVTADGNTSSIASKTDGKYLLEFEITERYTDEASWFTSPRGQHVVVKSPEFATKEQVTYIAQKFAAMEDKVFNNASKSELSTVMDVESFAKMYLIQEFSSNLDAASTSYYLTFDCSKNDAEGNGAVFVANPVWDYDWAYGQYTNSSKMPVSGNGQDTYLQTSNPQKWVAKYKSMDDSKGGSAYSIQSQLASQNSDFKAEIRKQWEGLNGFYTTIQKYYGTDGQIITWYNQIKDSVDMNETRWKFIKNNPISDWGSTNTGDTHADAVNYLNNTWTAARATWLNTQFTSEEYPAYTPSAPTIKAYAADGTTEISAVEAGSPFIIKVTSDLESGVVYRLYKDGVKVGTDQSDGKFDIATDESMVGSKYTYTVTAVYGGRESSASTGVEITINEKAGKKTVRVYFKSAAASAYVPSFSLDHSAATVMSRTPKTSNDNGTYFGSTYSGSLKFYWFFKDITIDTSVPHDITFTTKDNRVNATTSYTFGAATEYYFAVDNLMGDTTLVDLTSKEEYIRNYHISATHMVRSATEANNVGFTWAKDTEGNYKEYAMGTYLEDNNISTASLTDLTSSSLLTIPSALTPNAMLQASTAPSFFTIKSATLAQRITADISEVSTLQYQLLDVNLDGVVDVKDSTMMQKALAGI